MLRKFNTKVIKLNQISINLNGTKLSCYIIKNQKEENVASDWEFFNCYKKYVVVAEEQMYKWNVDFSTDETFLKQNIQ